MSVPSSTSLPGRSSIGREALERAWDADSPKLSPQLPAPPASWGSQSWWPAGEGQESSVQETGSLGMAEVGAEGAERTSCSCQVCLGAVVRGV